MKLNIQIKNTYCLLLISFITNVMNAQQDPEYTQYMYNTMTVNAAYAGSAGTLEAILLHRSQWVGIEGAPETQAFAIHAPLSNERVGLGLSAVNDKLGPSNELFLDGNFSYTIPLAYDKKLAFGLKAGVRMLNVDWSKGRFNNPIDPVLNENISNNFKPSLGAGIYYYSDKWYFGASVPNFIRNDYYDDVQEAVNRDRFHYFFIGGYVFDISDNLKFKPAFLVKAVSGAPLSYDLSANFLIHEKFTAGASYRWDDSVSALAGFQVTKSIFIGYAFDYTVSDLNKYNDGSHEIILRFQMQKKSSQMKSPRFF
ncbi:PorP/SprF family type IX secretion system membrane protein [Flavobacterium wongokense]|uniref:PorP/SprF family type IX secretion system membrane protein n=1 Tax=Flavobacterium wongokense TaxID=2910674 RepID=UPI001F24F7EB|nr:type IX secretion system membrane protein PorP/SprF [Flavobacterium sp. WG47]MCF6132063.1 type IX secretion system membrane protein PorP/SprF [Flavobacterium sp. WG47]